MRQQARALLILASLTAISGCASRPLADACYQPPASGQCRAAIERYYFDPQGNRCKAFIWGGCGGQVPFETLESCNTACKPPGDASGEREAQHE